MSDPLRTVSAMCSVCDDFADRFAAGNVDSSYGAIAQLVERFHGMEEVKGSIPFSSTPLNFTEGPVTDWSLGGFVAGEGYFVITTKQPPFRNGDPRLRFVFGLHIARRDRPLLERLVDRIGFGSIQDRRPSRSHWQPSSVFTVSSLKGHRNGVIPFLDRFLLPSAKREQFELWCRAMDSYETFHPSHHGRGPSVCRIAGCDRPVRGRGLCRSHYHQETGY